MKKVIEYIILSIDFILIICVAGFVEENPIMSVVSLALFALVTNLYKRNFWSDDYLKMEEK